eukprot:3515952-Pyramimonas_sp.AAC.1
MVYNGGLLKGIGYGHIVNEKYKRRIELAVALFYTTARITSTSTTSSRIKESRPRTPGPCRTSRLRCT